MHFLNGIDVEIGKCRAAHFRVGGIDAVHGKDRSRAALAVDRELLGKIRRAVGVGHGAGGQQQQFAEVARIERQARNFRAGKMLAAAGLRRRFCSRGRDTKFLLLDGKLQSCG